MNKFILLLCFILHIRSGTSAQTGESEYKSIYISKVPKPTAPAKLEISNVRFQDIDGNKDNILDAKERGVISFDVANNGKGNAYNLLLECNEASHLRGFLFDKSLSVGNIESSAKSTYKIPVSATTELVAGEVKMTITIKEANGFDSDPFLISFKTESFKTPLLVIADKEFTNMESAGKIKLGENINLKLLIQNKGQGIANEVKVSFKNPENVFAIADDKYQFTSLQPGETRTISYEFLPNKRYVGSTLSIGVIVEEQLGLYGVNEKLELSLEKELSQTMQVAIEGQRKADIIIKDASLTSDVDNNIPDNKIVNSNRYALIIGNEDYAKYQTGLNTESNVQFAINDARSFKEYCLKTMGVPEANLIFSLNATSGQMLRDIDKINKIIKNSGGDAEVIVYFAGHGLPDEEKKEPYLFPVDVSGADIQRAIKLQDIYTQLTQYPSKRVTVFLDACFTGGGRSQGLLAARMIKTKPTANVLSGNIVVYTASSGEQTSLPWTDKHHGMFTYCLLKAIKEKKGDLNYQQLFDTISKEIKLQSVLINSKEQTPELLMSSQINAHWREWKIN
jgi:hypothetical protein